MLFTYGCRYVDTVVLVYSLDVICVQIAAISGNVMFRKLMRSTVGDVINL